MELNPAKTASPGDVDRALRDLWAGEVGQVTRACLFNLIVYGTDPSLTAAGAQAATEVAEQAPCRSLIITAQPNAPAAPLEASVTGSCRLSGGGGREVCCEQILLRADGDARRSLPAMVAALLIPDVRVFLLPVGDVLAGDSLVARWVNAADRTVIDSSQFSDPPTAFLAAAELFGGTAGQVRQVSDLHWMRCVPWREALAELVDPPVCRGFLGMIDFVRVTYSASDPGRPLSDASQALLYAGWLAGSLGWIARPGRRVQAGRTELQADASGRDVRLCLAAGASTGGPRGTLTQVEIEGQGHRAELQLSADGASVSAQCTLSGECAPPRTHPLPQLSVANLIAGAVQLRSRQAAWRLAVATMQPWLG